MHKSELEGMTLAELTALAGKLGAELSDDQTTLIYNILDAQSLQAPIEAPKKRGRKPKAQKEAEAQVTEITPAQTEAKLDSSRESQQTEEAPAPKKRGRKSKAEKAAIEQEQNEASFSSAERKQARPKVKAAEEAAKTAEEQKEETATHAPIITDTPSNSEGESKEKQPAAEKKRRKRISETKEQEVSPKGGDLEGTVPADFIIIQDIPSIEE